MKLDRIHLVLAAVIALAPMSLACSEASPSRVGPIPPDSREACRGLFPDLDTSITPPVELRRLQPRPPRAAGDSGFACVQVTVSAQGTVISPRLLRTNNPIFAAACLDTVLQWQYRPALRHGGPVPLDIVVSSSFARK
jgi:TonB family protein